MLICTAPDRSRPFDGPRTAVVPKFEQLREMSVLPPHSDDGEEAGVGADVSFVVTSQAKVLGMKPQKLSTNDGRWQNLRAPAWSQLKRTGISALLKLV